MQQRYISFSPYYSGLTNVIMNYELAFSLAIITGRTLIIPKDTWLVFISDSQADKTQWSDLWQIFDRQQAESLVPSVRFEDVPEFQQVFDKMETYRSRTGNIRDHVEDLYYYQGRRCLSDDHVVFVNDIHQHIASEDFHKFSQGRRIEDLNRPEKFLHFEDNLFGHFWYNIYPGGPAERNQLKDKINTIFRYRSELYDIAKQVKQQIGSYNAVHIRRNDFLQVHPEMIGQAVGTGDRVLSAVRRVFPKNLPLYVATDEPNKDFFAELAKEYTVYFYNDFNFNLPKLQTAAVEQIICSEAEFFYGTYLSTYSKRINIMRGLLGRQAADYAGINNIVETNTVEIGNRYPWINRSTPKWYWNDSSYIQWTRE